MIFTSNGNYTHLRGGLGCNWGKLSREFKFLPRISYHNVILFQATWQLAKEDYVSIINVPDDLLVELVTKWRLEWKMPSRILIVEGDNELFIELTSYLSLKVFIKEIKNKQFVTLKEFDFNEINNLVSDTEGYNYTNQFISVFNKRNVDDHKNKFEDSVEEHNCSRSFPIGADWLYYKIYCGASIADEILINNIKNVVILLQKKELIEKWFFIRYADPKPHIRLRFKLTEKNNVEMIVKHIYETLQNPLQEQLISRIQTDTYEREIERYGSQTIDLSETIFCIDSETTLNFLNYNEILKEDKRWLYGLFSMDALLNAFHYVIEDKIRVLKKLQFSFGKEFGMNDTLRKALNNKLEKHNQVIKSFLDMAETDENTMIFRQFIKDKENAIKPIAKEIIKILKKDNNKIDDLIISYIHMLHNRLFISEQRVHELVLYDFLYKTYQTIKHSKMIMIES